MIVLVLALAYLAAASDPCNSPELHRGMCQRAVDYGPVSRESRALDEYRRAEFGVVPVVRRAEALSVPDLAERLAGGQ